MWTRELTVRNHLGIHARAAARFVHTASGFQSRVRVGRGHRVMDGKSIMGVLLLAAGCGSAITISAEGPDEAEALEALCQLVESGFGEEPCTA